jgi:hypothetical protein
MQEVWIDHLSRLLKSFESEKNGRAIHELRRSFKAGKKQARLLPQVEAIYLASKDRDDFKPESDPILYQTWFNQQKFKLTLGLKEVTLVSTGDPVQLKANIYRLFSKWDPNLYSAPPEEKISQNFGISNKQLKMAMKQMNRLTDEQLAAMVAKIPEGQELDVMNTANLEELLPSESARGTASAIAERVKTVMKK